MQGIEVPIKDVGSHTVFSRSKTYIRRSMREGHNQKQDGTNNYPQLIRTILLLFL
jgi:hypothetical protein